MCLSGGRSPQLPGITVPERPSGVKPDGRRDAAQMAWPPPAASAGQRMAVVVHTHLRVRLWLGMQAHRHRF